MASETPGRARACWLGLGANLGERERSLRLALEMLSGTEGVELRAVSPFYRTAPWGVKNQPDFINAAACIMTTLSPMELLRAANAIESRLGRVREELWGPRTIDIDLLHMEGISMASATLSLPPPRLAQRAFVLVPLAQIAGGLIIDGKSVRAHLAHCTDTGDVEHTPGSPADLGLTLIACVDRHGGLGRDGDLLFRLAEDLHEFRAQTQGRTVVLGRRTLATFPGGRPLPGRRCIVLSKSVREIPGAEVASSLEELWALLRGTASPICVIGGEIVYRELLPYCTEAIVTHVDADGGADAFLPRLDGPCGFVRISSRGAVDDETGISMELCRYRRAWSEAGDEP